MESHNRFDLDLIYSVVSIAPPLLMSLRRMTAEVEKWEINVRYCAMLYETVIYNEFSLLGPYQLFLSLVLISNY